MSRRDQQATKIKEKGLNKWKNAWPTIKDLACTSF